jgi:hypothetical protein
VAVKDANIKGQDNTYRRGLVLGLTMAEIMLLILFALLLALAGIFGSQKKVIQEKDRQIAELATFQQQLAELRRNISVGVSIDDVIKRIERQKSQIATLEKEIERLQSFEIGGKVLEDIIQKIQRSEGVAPTPKDIIARLTNEHVVAEKSAELQKAVEQMQEQARSTKNEMENLRGQVVNLASQIKQQGRGNEFPPCWSTPAGKAESIFEVTITANGIRIKDRQLPNRTKDRAALPLSAVQFNAELPLGSFQSELRPLFQWSVEKQCRFYVIIFSSVSSAPIQSVNGVNSFFYPDSPIRYRPGTTP